MCADPAPLPGLAAVLALVDVTPEAPHWPPAAWEQYLRGDDAGSALRRRLLTTQDNEGHLVGLAALTRLGETTELESLLVHPAHRRRGLGSLLCRRWLRWARADGALTAELELRESNTGALRLYRALGFAEQGRRPRYYRQPVEDAVTMALSLAP